MTSKRVRAGTIVIKDKRLLLVKLRDPHNQKDFLFPPGGKIEPGEDIIDAAERETVEETGYEVKADPDSHYPLRYDFHWNGKTHDCTTHFYHAKILAHKPEKFQPEDQYHEVVWKPLTEIPAIFSYHKVLQKFLEDYLRLAK